MKIELNEAQCKSIRAALNDVAWQLENTSPDTIKPINVGEWEFLTFVGAHNSTQLRELATLFQEEKGE